MKASERSLRNLVEGFRRGILSRRKSEGFCWAICAPLEGCLRFLGHDCELTEGIVNDGGERDEHFWITLSDGRIIDPTADQFRKPDGKRMPKIYIGKKPSWYRVARK